VSGLVIGSSTLFYGAYGFFKIEKPPEDIHAPLGILVTILTTGIPLTGILAHYKLRSEKSDPKLSRRIKRCHRVSPL